MVKRAESGRTVLESIDMHISLTGANTGFYSGGGWGQGKTCRYPAREVCQKSLNARKRLKSLYFELHLMKGSKNLCINLNNHIIFSIKKNG